MPGRRPYLSVAALPLAVLATAALPLPASAHRLEAEFRVLSGNRIQVESWFDLTGESPRGATVQVWRAEGGKLAEGELDDKGTFVFTFSEAEPFKVVVSAAGGHRKELLIPKEALNWTGPDVATPGAFADRSPRVSYWELLSGVALVFALASLFLSLRNARRLRKIMGKIPPEKE